ncbi:multiple sugar transport system permease protein [Thermosporothrix hazakensis]|jgi:multiple sugar transport system permease protein|uniref:Multiple sugar transport system permease protein n=1 Tax=Thermosporothrix hazakensis TaxID=644383 RepID=A0A326UAS4_THEHA|nr:sugar ABC transporter permease [Thermosporothrix hazakensis]PZW34356.1 multiple sugar transport system permease protein [Thermosporothrix hazakensis]GCE46095.1 sugar ABC transporter permease [Thermosporothrix hazakensis]
MSSPETPAAALMPSIGERESARRVRRSSIKTTLIFWSFVAPLMLGLILFFFVPIIWSIVLSFSEARAVILPTGFAGLRNYRDLLQDQQFTSSLLTFTIFAFFIVPTTFLCALGLALLVNSAKFAQGFFRSVFFLPTACSYVLASIVWKMSIFNGTRYGLANAILHLFNLDPVQWISSPNPPWYWLVLVTVRLWLQLGMYMIIFIAGLQEIPRELYEAALVDGAKRGWQTFWYITVPQLRNTSIAILLLNIIAAYQAFDEFWNIMSGGNQSLLRTPLMYLYNVALGSQDYGLGSAGAMILTIIIIFFTLLQGRLLGFGRSN